jgi:hypothetical protein
MLDGVNDRTQYNPQGVVLDAPWRLSQASRPFNFGSVKDG